MRNLHSAHLDRFHYWKYYYIYKGEFEILKKIIDFILTLCIFCNEQYFYMMDIVVVFHIICRKGPDAYALLYVEKGLMHMHFYM
jgi:hypothetical protein